MLVSETDLMTRLGFSWPSTGMLFKNHWYSKSLKPRPVAIHMNSARSPFLTATCIPPSVPVTPSVVTIIVTTGGIAIEYTN